MMAFAVIVGIFGLQAFFRRAGYNKEWAIDIVLIMVIGGVLGARILYILLYQRDILFSQPSALFAPPLEISGLIWYGGGAGAIIPFGWYLRKRKLPALSVLDLIAPWLALCYGTVRIGCYLAGCCFGKVAPETWGVVFPLLDNISRYPTQLYSAGLNYLLAGTLFWLFPRRKFTGQVFFTYALGYALYRFIIEFYRVNTIMFGWFSYAQIVAAVIFILALWFYYKYAKTF